MKLSYFTSRFVLAALLAVSVSSATLAQTAPPASRDDVEKPKAPVAMKLGDVLSGQLNAMKLRGKVKGKRLATYQLVSEPRRLPAPGGLCNLETGPETFQIVADNDAQATQLKKFIGKQIALKVDQVACAEEAGVMSEAVVTKWSVVAKP
ncbi:MAG: hypothetical protein JWR73_798 [Tardiphaga sp.]|jgi:hypothetical protein|nr:hypothetical protein [Tardiphaga sp.]MDB5521780.1 hypothetical protein [Tardiphaga sp.]MDB5548002.1 hypothetical protein [Tardiphaga sp.]MDB5624996.1 hypothetical protein [Tardiphaga sp.]